MDAELEKDTTFDELRTMLIEANFQWVVDNIDLAVEQGIQEEHQLRRYHEHSKGEESTRKSRERQERVIGSRTPNAREKLEIALDEIERCIVVPLEIANDLPKSLAASSDSPVAVEVINDATNETVFKVSVDELVDSTLLSNLSKAIQELRGGN